MKRPTGLTVIAWLLIVFGGLSIIGTIFTLNNPLTAEMMSKIPVPVSIQYIIMFAGIIITVVSGFSILFDQGWGRYLYVIWSVLAILYSLATSPMKFMLILSVVILIVFAYFMFNKKANEYFKTLKIQEDETGN
jgi:hypothetical protein